MGKIQGARLPPDIIFLWPFNWCLCYFHVFFQKQKKKDKNTKVKRFSHLYLLFLLGFLQSLSEYFGSPWRVSFSLCLLLFLYTEWFSQGTGKGAVWLEISLWHWNYSKIKTHMDIKMREWTSQHIHICTISKTVRAVSQTYHTAKPPTCICYHNDVANWQQKSLCYCMRSAI